MIVDNLNEHNPISRESCYAVKHAQNCLNVHYFYEIHEGHEIHEIHRFFRDLLFLIPVRNISFSEFPVHFEDLTIFEWSKRFGFDRACLEKTEIVSGNYGH